MRLTWTTDAAQEAGTLPFVNVASDGRYSDHTRSLIRSHVMLGKNRGRRNRQKGHAKGSTNASAVPVSDAGRSAPSNRSVREPEEEAMWVRVPPKMGSDAYFSEFPTEVGLELLDSVRTLNTTMVGSTRLFSREKAWWLEPLAGDMVVLHFTVYLAKAYQSHVRGTDATDKDVLHHYVRTLALLQQRVGDAGNELATSDRTIEVVMGLATVAAFKHDGEVARKHLEGLKKMVALRGGPWGLERKVLFNICYADVGRSLSTGEKTVFFAGEGAWSSYIAAPTKAFHSYGAARLPISARDGSGIPSSYATFLRALSISQHQNLAESHDPHATGCVLGPGGFHALDARLQAVYTDLSELARAANLAVWSNRDTDTAAYSRYQVSATPFPIPRCWNNLTSQGTFYRGIMFSALYRLLNLDFGSGNVDAVMRLGLLAVASTLFSQWRGSKERYEYIAQELLGALVSLEKEEYGLPREVVLWLYVVGCVSVFNERERAVIMPTLVQLLGQMQMKTWDETRAVLKAFLWVDAMHDTVAEEVLVPVIFPRWEQQQQLLVSAK